MQKMMLKDFIKYNSPCFACNSKVEIYLSAKTNTSINNNIRCFITNKETQIPIKIGYSNSLELVISHKDNIIKTNNLNSLLNYCKEYELSFCSLCSNKACRSYISTQNISFNINNFRLNSILLKIESFVIYHNDFMVVLETKHIEEKSNIMLFGNDSLKKIFEVTVPTFNLMKLKSKEKFIEKMKKYIAFS